jgi:hypothetical protein
MQYEGLPWLPAPQRLVDNVSTQALAQKLTPVRSGSLLGSFWNSNDGLPLSLRFNQNQVPSHRMSGRFCDA